MYAVQAAAAVAACLAAAFDLRVGRIPNWLTGAAFASGVVLNAWLGGTSGLLDSLSGAALGLALLLPFYALRGMGAGDVKLLAAMGALLGLQGVISVAVYGGLLGGALSMVVLVARGRLTVMLREALILQRLPSASRLTAPYGVAIAGGVCLALALPPVLA